MDDLKPNPRKIPALLGPIVSYTIGANCVFIKKDQGKAIWKDVLKPNLRKTICNIVWIILYTISTNYVFIKKIKVKRFEWTFEVKFTRYNSRIISYKQGSNHVFTE